MTDKTIARKADGTPTKTPGWFSWRHKTRDAHDEARERYLSAHGRKSRRRRAAERPDPPHDRTRAHREGRCTCERAR